MYPGRRRSDPALGNAHREVLTQADPRLPGGGEEAGTQGTGGLRATDVFAVWTVAMASQAQAGVRTYQTAPFK